MAGGSAVVQVSFAVESQMQQHLAGPAHRKAVERAAAEERRLEQLGNNRWAAENATVPPPPTPPFAPRPFHTIVPS